MLGDEIKRAQEAQKLLNDPAVQEALKQQKQLRDAGVDLDRIKAQAAVARDVVTPQRFTVNIKEFVDAVESLRKPLPPEWVEARQNFIDFSQRVVRTVADVRASLVVATGPLRNFIYRYQEANRLVNEALRNAPKDSPLGLMMRQATDVYRLNAYRIEKGIDDRNLLTTNPGLAAQLFVPTVSYLEFSQRTMSRIAESEDPDQRAALGGSLIIAEEHVTDATSLIVAVESEEQLAEPRMSASSKTYAIYEAVQLDLIDVGTLPSEATYPVLVRFSSAASLAELTRQTLSAIIRCNKTSRLRGSREIFKVTTQAQEALVVLPGLVVRDESSLRDFITHLYILIYEGAGDQNLRFLKAHNGPMDNEECDAIWNLKALRNKWLIHDPEHGDAKAIDKSYCSLAEALQKLGFNTFPATKREFEELQRKVLNALLEFHTLLELRVASI